MTEQSQTTENSNIKYLRWARLSVVTVKRLNQKTK